LSPQIPHIGQAIDAINRRGIARPGAGIHRRAQNGAYWTLM
jgi:hypothetical protein